MRCCAGGKLIGGCAVAAGSEYCDVHMLKQMFLSRIRLHVFDVLGILGYRVAATSQLRQRKLRFCVR